MFRLRKILTSIDISLCPTMKKHPLTGTTTWDDAVHTIPEDGAAYGVHATLTFSPSTCAYQWKTSNFGTYLVSHEGLVAARPKNGA
jgi:hypothetical protein